MEHPVALNRKRADWKTGRTGRVIATHSLLLQSGLSAVSLSHHKKYSPGYNKLSRNIHSLRMFVISSLDVLVVLEDVVCRVRSHEW